MTGAGAAERVQGWLRAGLLLGNTVLGVLLVGAACLRETPLFWTHAGGYPVGLRFLVRFGFFPLWLAVAVVTLGVLGRGLASLRREGMTGLLSLAAGSVQGGLLLVATCIAFHNNISNLLSGLPLHYHP